MNKTLQDKIINLTMSLKAMPVGKGRHFSFILKRNKILSIGWNDGWKTHPISKQFNYRYHAIHSELSAILRYDGYVSDLAGATIVNTRINWHDEVAMSMPCPICLKLLKKNKIKRIYYTNDSGEFIKHKDKK